MLMPGAAPAPGGVHLSCSDVASEPVSQVRLLAARVDGSGCRAFDFPFIVLDYSPALDRVAGVDGEAVYTANLDGSNVRRIMDRPFGLIGPRLSPDGAMVAYVLFPSTCLAPFFQPCQDAEIWIGNADGSNFHELTNGSSLPVWAPDSRRLTFVGLRAGSAVVTVMSVDGTGRREFAPLILADCGGHADAQLTWSRRGTWIAYTSGGTVYRVGADGTGRKRLAAGCSPAWSPDSRQVAFVTGHELSTVNHDGTGLRRLDRVRGFYDEISAPEWSPNGRLIAYAKRTLTAYGTANRLFVVSANGRRPPRLVTWEPLCSQVFDIRWFTDGRGLLHRVYVQGCEPD